MRIRHKNKSQPKKEININNKNVYQKANINNNPFLINFIKTNNFWHKDKIKSNINKKILIPRGRSQDNIKASASNQIKNNENNFNNEIIINNINFNNKITNRLEKRPNIYINKLFDKKLVPKKDNIKYNKAKNLNNYIENKIYIKDNKILLDKKKEMAFGIIKQREEENKKKKEKEEEERRKKEEEKKIILEKELRRKEEKSENEFNMGLIPSNFISFLNKKSNNARENLNYRNINLGNNHNNNTNINEPFINNNFENTMHQEIDDFSNYSLSNYSFNENNNNNYINENVYLNNRYNINNNYIHSNGRSRFNNGHRDHSILENSNDILPLSPERNSNHLLNNFKYKPIKDNILSKLPENRIKDTKKLNEENKRCTICLEDFKYNDVVIYLPCFHIFHKNCIIYWINQKAFCPLCKFDINNIKNQNIYYS